MHPMIHQLMADAPLLSDGAWGTQMQALGLPVGACPDAWNLTQPDKVEAVARAYVAAGSKIILTNTFGASRVALARHGLADEAAAINRAGAEISKRAAGTQALVFGSIGPSGKMLMMDEITPEELASAFVEQAQALAAGGVDGLLVETMSDLAEARLALAAAKATGLPVIVSMTFSAGKTHDRTVMGVTPEQAAVALTEAGADAIGANCGLGIADYVPICERLHAATPLPIWIKPNAGMPVLVAGQTQYTTTAEEFAAYLPALLAAGATFVGGCCGSTPDFVRVLAHALANDTAKEGRS
jgi:5-methyltetrahydrofolate--homocysteine methyltransferase